MRRLRAARILSNGCRTTIVERANRFARDLIVKETGFAMLKGQGVALIAADSPDAFQDDTPTAELIRQILGAVSEFEKSMIVAKLKGPEAYDWREGGGEKNVPRIVPRSGCTCEEAAPLLRERPSLLPERNI